MLSAAQIHKRLLLAGALLAAAVTFAVFITAWGNQFVDFDDLGYIPAAISQDQFGLQTLVWAFSSYPGANWHPLTMLSLVIDAHIWGDNPLGYHLTNILLHCSSVFLSCFLFSNLLSVAPHNPPETGFHQSAGMGSRPIVFASLAGALFFGLHPLRVESVVWASERKDVLCLFWLVTSLLWYLRHCHVRSESPAYQFWCRPSYWMMLLTACLAMLSKPLAVSFPLVLLIIDWYPLARFRNRAAFREAVLEKLPLFLMSAVCIVMTMIAQQAALSRAPQVDLSSRLLVAGKALFFYLWKTLWPNDLSAMYPHPGTVAKSALGEYLIYAGAAAVISILAIGAGRRNRLWLAFWMFYVLTLTPMLGIVQVGAQWVADRYSYFPSLGISLLWGCGVVHLVRLLLRRGKRQWALLAASLAFAQLVFLADLSVRQISVWRTTETLTTRIINQIPDHPEAPYYTRAKYRNETGAYEEALQDIDMSLLIALRYHQKKKYPEIYIAKAHVLSNLGRLREALEHANLALESYQAEPPPAYVAFRNELLSLVSAGHSGQ